MVKTSENGYGWEVYGVRDGFEGFLVPKGRGLYRIDRRDIAGILPLGGTILGASNRCNIFEVPHGAKIVDESPRVLECLAQLDVSGLIVVGGEGTHKAAARLHRMGVPVVGVPKTIDNDLAGTDYTFGFDTAVSIVAEALDRLHTTAEAHHRVMVVEVIGRHAGWIVVEGGLAGGADIILIPEFPFDMDEICAQIQKRRERGKMFSIVVVAEGARPKDASLIVQSGETGRLRPAVRLGGIGTTIAREIVMRTAIDTRVTVLGHIQRGGSPTAFDRILATRFGIAAIDLVSQEKFGFMVGLRGNRIVPGPFEEPLAETKPVDAELYEIAKVFFEFIVHVKMELNPFLPSPAIAEHYERVGLQRKVDPCPARNSMSSLRKKGRSSSPSTDIQASFRLIWIGTSDRMGLRR